VCSNCTLSLRDGAVYDYLGNCKVANFEVFTFCVVEDSDLLGYDAVSLSKWFPSL